MKKRGEKIEFRACFMCRSRAILLRKEIRAAREQGYILVVYTVVVIVVVEEVVNGKMGSHKVEWYSEMRQSGWKW